MNKIYPTIVFGGAAVIFSTAVWLNMNNQAQEQKFADCVALTEEYGRDLKHYTGWYGSDEDVSIWLKVIDRPEAMKKYGHLSPSQLSLFKKVRAEIILEHTKKLRPERLLPGEEWTGYSETDVRRQINEIGNGICLDTK